MVFTEESAAETFEFGSFHLHLIPIILAAGTGGSGLSNGFELYATFFAETFEVGECEHAFYFYVVGLLETIPVFQELCGEVAIVGHEDQAGSGVLEIADGINAFGETAKKIAERFSAFGIGEGGNDFGRFVEKEIDRAWGGFDEAAGGFDFVGGGIGFGAKLGDGLAVDADLAGKDELFSVAARSDTGARDDFLQAFKHGRRIAGIGRQKTGISEEEWKSEATKSAREEERRVCGVELEEPTLTNLECGTLKIRWGTA